MVVHRALAVVAFVGGALLLSPTVPADAHETGAIRVASKEVPVGGQIGVHGEKLPKREALTLQLRGILDNYDVGRVTTDSTGRFEAQLPVPQAAPAGTYTLVAIASDGDVTARADLVVTAAPATAGSATAGSATAGSHDMAGMGDMAGPHATAEPMRIDRASTAGERVVMWGAIILSFLAGAFLLLRPTTV